MFINSIILFAAISRGDNNIVDGESPTTVSHIYSRDVPNSTATQR